MPLEIQQLRYIDRFGGHAVMGRTLGVGEMRRMISSENIVNWYNQRGPSEKWAEWAKANKPQSAALNQAMILAVKMGLIDG